MAHQLYHTLLQFRDDATTSDNGVQQGNDQCSRPLTDDIGEPIAGSLTFHHLMILICAPCLAMTIISCVLLSWRHLHRYTAPQEQRQILRIINLPVFYSTFNFLGLLFYMDYFYITPIASIYEAFVIAALFLLVLEWACPDGTDREKYFENLEGQDKKGKPLPGGSLKWFQKTWVQALQFPLSKTILVSIQIITQLFGVYCENSMKPSHAHLWLLLFDIFVIGGAFEAVTKFARRLGKEKAIDPIHRARGKIFALLGIILFQLVQMIIFGIMNGKLFKASKKITYNDLNFGIPALLTCVEGVIFSLIFHWAYSASEYKEGNRMDRYGMAPASRTKTLEAILDALNLSDIIAATAVALKLLPGALSNKFSKTTSRYGSRGQGGSIQRLREGQLGMEPLSDRSRMGGYSDGSAGYSPALESEQYAGGMRVPAVPRSARDPSPAGRVRTFRADELRPGMGGSTEYEPLAGSREPSPSGLPTQWPRPMV